MTRSIWRVFLMILEGVGLLVALWFEDTTVWSRERIVLAKRAFACAMLILLFASLFFTLKAIGDVEHELLQKRVDRIEARQDENFREHVVVQQRLSVVERDTQKLDELRERVVVIESNTKHMDRLVYGVVGLTFAVIAQWILALLRFKLDRDDRSVDLDYRKHRGEEMAE